jgi:predicted enzyme related to lactoylglutathione lyase
MSNPVNWFHITTQDVEGLGKFYGEAFDWKMSAGPGGMIFADSGAGGIPGGIAAPSPGGDEKSTIHMYVGTPNIEAQLARIEKAGGRPAGFKHDLGNDMGWISGFIDPAGNFVGLWQRPEPPPEAPKKKAARKAAKKATKAAEKATKKAAKAAKKAAKPAKRAEKKAAPKAGKAR